MRQALLDIILLPRDIVRSVTAILTSPKLLGWCLVPWGLGAAAFAGAVSFIAAQGPALAPLVGLSPDHWLGAVVESIGFGLGLILAAIAALIVTVTVGGIFFDFFIEELLRRRGLLTLESTSLAAAARRALVGLRDDVVRLTVLGCIAVVGMCAGFFPPLLFLSFALGAFVIGFDLLDLPLAVLGIRFRSRWRLLNNHRLELFVVGIAASFIVVVPLVNLLALPVFYTIAVDRLVRWESEVRGLLSPR